MNFITLPLFSKLNHMPEEGIHLSDDGNYVCIVHVDLETVKLAIDAKISFGAQKITHDTVRLFFSFGTSITAHALTTIECMLDNENFKKFIAQDTLRCTLVYSIDSIPYFGFVTSFKPDPAIRAEIQAMYSPEYVTHHTVQLSSISLDAIAHGTFYCYELRGDARKEMLSLLDSVAYSHTPGSLWFAPNEQGTRILSTYECPTLPLLFTTLSVFEHVAVPFGFTDGEGTVVVCALDKDGIAHCASKGDKERYEKLYPLWN